MSFHDVQFPPVIALGAAQGPSFSTQIVTTAGGAERRNINWSQARRRYNVGTGLRNRADAAVLLAFFHARQGRAFGFRFKDFSDFELPRQVIGATNGSQASFAIYKRYSSGGVHHDRPITRPVAGTVRCWQNTVERTIGAGATQFQVNLATGIVTLGATLAAATGQAIEVQCEFDTPCRFDTDDMSLAISTFYNQEWADISIVEVRP